MPLIEMKVLEGMKTEVEKQEVIERLTDTVAVVNGEPHPAPIGVLIAEIHSRARGAGGCTVSTDDVDAVLEAQQTVLVSPAPAVAWRVSEPLSQEFDDWCDGEHLPERLAWRRSFWRRGASPMRMIPIASSPTWA
jgi:4-oxalocrotonate tautomerase